MKNLTSNSLRIIPAALGLVFALLANHAGATTYYTWDPQGTTGGSPYTSSLSGTWEDNNWSTNVTGIASPGAWVEGTNAYFAVASGTGTPAFTVTMNNNHTVAGILDEDGPGVLQPCTMTISGSGTLILGATAGFFVETDNSSVGSLTINNVISGTGAINAHTQPGTSGTTAGTLTLTGVNTYTGGFYVGGVGAVYYGNNGNNAAFGTGTITWHTNGTILPNDNSAYNIANAMTHGAYTETFGANSGGVTFSGNWALGSSSPVTIANSTGGYGITVSGPIGGSATLVLTNSSGSSGASWTFTGPNTYQSVTTITNGTLTIGGSGYLGAGIYSGAMGIGTGATFNYASSAVQTNTGIISGSGALTVTGTGTLYSTRNNTYTGGTTIGSGATLIITGGGSLAAVGAIVNNGTFIFNSTNSSATLSGLISGSGALTQGSGTLNLSGTGNGYSGGTTINGGTLHGKVAGSIPGNVTVNSGTLQLDNAAAMSSTATLTLDSTAAVVLNFAVGTPQTINALYFGSTPQATGLWGAPTNVSATYTDSRFSGTGLLNITTGGATPTPPSVTGIGLDPYGNISLTVTGAVGTVWSLRTNNNVAAPLPWPNMTNGIIPSNPFTVLDVPPANSPHRYYYLTNAISP